MTKTALTQTIVAIMAAPIFLVIQNKAHAAWDRTLKRWGSGAQEEEG